MKSHRLINRSVERFLFFIIRYDTIQSDKREGEKEGEKIKKPVYKYWLKINIIRELLPDFIFSKFSDMSVNVHRSF